uniref:LysM domain-containing protein n=1 Tax=Pseudomonas phage HRDY3 TaxID=3236930 RepID=A0AB39CE42_9VIRU
MNALIEEIHQTAEKIEELSEKLDPRDRDVFFTRCALCNDPQRIYTEMWFERANARDFAIYNVAPGDNLQEIFDRFQPDVTMERFAFINNISDPANPPVGLLITLKDVK